MIQITQKQALLCENHALKKCVDFSFLQNSKTPKMAATLELEIEEYAKLIACLQTDLGDEEIDQANGLSLSLDLLIF